MYVYYIHNNTCVDQPVVKITATTGGCGYAYASWTTTGSSNVCRITQYNVTLSSATVNVTISISGMNSYNFTGLPDDTLFNVTVTGINMTGFVSVPDSTSVRTMICISMYIHIQRRGRRSIYMTILAIYVSWGITNDYGQLFTEQYTSITKY